MFKRILDCPRQAEYAVREKEGDPEAVREALGFNYHASAGTLVQKLYECYFNQRVNLRPGGTQPEVVAACCAKVLASKFAEKVIGETTYPQGKSKAELLKFVATSAATGLTALFESGILGKEVRSEVPSAGSAGGRRIFAQIDFLVKTSAGSFIYDGKINSAPTADPRQLWYAALTRTEPVRGGGFIYWKLGKFVPVKFDAETLAEFKAGDFAKGMARWEPVMTTGVDTLEATPSWAACQWCSWGGRCRYARQAPRREPDYSLPAEIDWGDLD
jgi:hypothetical protein